MTPEKIKENLSKGFISLLASYSGYTYSMPNEDYGVDIVINRVCKHPFNGKNIYRETGEKLDIQLKATTEKSITEENGIIKYDFEVKNYNDMVRRKDVTTPLYLLLFILPEEEHKWFKMLSKAAVLYNRSYLYSVPSNATLSTNNKTERIKIDKANKVNIVSLDSIFKKAYP